MTSTPDHRDRYGEPPDERYEFVDLREYDAPRDERGQVVVDDPDDDIELGDDEAPAPRPRRRRTAAAGRKTAARKTTSKPRARSRGRGRRSSEFAIGALVCMVAVGVGAYWLTYDVAGYPRDFCLVASGVAAGLATWSGRALVVIRRRLAAMIAPKGARA